MKTKVVYIGNCQAQAFQGLSGYLKLEVEVSRVPAVFVLKDDDEATIASSLDGADIIFSQRLEKNYPVAFLRNDVLRQRYGDKVVVWPNIYFDGYFPGIRYIYGADGKIDGPIRDYHFDWIYNGWQNNTPVEDVAVIADSLSTWTERKDFVEASIFQLRARERPVDVKISDYIVDNFRAMKLFHSMNHPHTSVLVEMLKRLFRFAGLPFESADFSRYPYHLDQVEIPILPVFKQGYRPTFETKGVVFKGCGLTEDTLKPTDEVMNYSTKELIERFYQVYDRAFSGAQSSIQK